MTTAATETVTAAPSASWTALENTRLAYERTLMAWIRTAVSLISFGFTIYKFFQSYQEVRPGRIPQVEHLITPRALGMFMITMGLGSLLLANVEHYRCMRALRLQYPSMGRSLALVLAAFISAFGVLALIAVIFRQ